MKGLFTIQFFLLLSYNLFSQETKFIEISSSDSKKSKEERAKDRKTITIGSSRDFGEEYYVLKSDETIRHGTYVKYRHAFNGIQILESGTYLNGLKSGLWEYFQNIQYRNSTNGIKEKGTFVNGKRNGVWTSYYNDTISQVITHEKFGNKRKIDSVNIFIDQRAAKVKTIGMYLNDKRVGEWISFTPTRDTLQRFNFSKGKLLFDSSLKDTLNYNTNRNAIFIGGPICMEEFLINEFDLRGNLMESLKSDSTSVIVSFTIDRTGYLIEPEIESPNTNKALEEEVLRVVALTNDKWIPGIFEKAPVNTVYRIKFFIFAKKISPIFRKFFIRINPVFD